MALVSELAAAIAEIEGIPPRTMEVIVRHTRNAGFLSTGARGRNAPPATVADAVNLILAANAGGSILLTAPDAIPAYRKLESEGGYRYVKDTSVGREYLPIEDQFFKFLSEPVSLGDALENIVGRFISLGDDSLERYFTTMVFNFTAARQNRTSIDSVKDFAEIYKTATATMGLNIKFEVTFCRPIPHASICVSTFNQVIAQVNFTQTPDELLLSAESGKSGACGLHDRKECVTIGFPTFSRIGDVLRGDGEGGQL